MEICSLFTEQVQYQKRQASSLPQTIDNEYVARPDPETFEGLFCPATGSAGMWAQFWLLFTWKGLRHAAWNQLLASPSSAVREQLCPQPYRSSAPRFQYLITPPYP
jgi:hypothetical protein